MSSRVFTALLLALGGIGCGRAPSPLSPQLTGSIGVPHRGVLTGSLELPRAGEGWTWLRQDDRHHALPRFVRALEHAATEVARQRPGGMLVVGDLSARGGGQLLPHLSHRTGRDADLLLYMTTLDGAPVQSPGFVHVGPDGLAWDPDGKRWLRFDVERTWLLVKTLVEDPNARIQWVFVHRSVEALLVEWAQARGDSPETILRAMEVMLEPHPGGPHDDHVHVRTACAPDELGLGCEPTGPRRAWIDPEGRPWTAESDEELLAEIFRPFSSTRGAKADAQVAAPYLLARADARDLATFVEPATADLAYLDPPFMVDRRFGARVGRGSSRATGPIAYDDVWTSVAAYLRWLEERVAAARETLTPRGTMWLHLDQRAVHEAKGVCDRVFGLARFRGEVVWVPGNGSKSRRGPGMGHQTLLVYARAKEPIWNGKDPALREPFAATSLEMHFTNVDDRGRRYRDRKIGGKTYRYYADEGRALGSVWTDCPAMAANTPLLAEATGYPTQKPLKLLDRIVRATSDPGSLVLDPFCGSGTTLVAAAAAGRRFAGCDVGALAIATTQARLDAARIPYRLAS